MNNLRIKKSNVKILKSKGHPDITQTTYNISQSNDERFNSVLFRDIYNVYSNRFGAENVLVRAVNSEGIRTFKTFDQDELNFTDFHEYYANKVARFEEFEMFYSLEITVRS